MKAKQWYESLFEEYAKTYDNENFVKGDFEMIVIGELKN
jgi:hypothetical protein